MTDASHDVGDLLAQWSGGDAAARNAAIRRVYDDLRGIARNRLRREGDLVALETTELVHEAYLRLAAQHRTRWQSRAHFFAIAARTMRRILVDQARARHAHKRGDRTRRIELDRVDLPAPSAGLDLELLAAALDGLERQDRALARIIELRYFAGLTVTEIADAVGTSASTTKRALARARAWLRREMQRES